MNFRQLAVSAAMGVTVLSLGAGPAAAADSGSAGSEIAPGQTVVYDNDTFSTALILNPVGASAFGVGLDANPFDNLYAGAAPFVCSAL